MGQGPMRVFVGNQQVHCPFCRHHLFSRRDIKLNSTGMSLLGLDWTNKPATGLICAQCGRIELFFEPRIRCEPA
jgi:predicted nucleic-acid-binding Zn-ribbon protein